MNKIDRYLAIVGVFLGAFIVAMIVIYCVKGTEPQYLITGVLGAGGGECILCATITIADKLAENRRKRITAGSITGFDDADIIELESEEDNYGNN